ncbi:MFS general substrate transporter [Neolentinus lepideus HHB14362 ss-1]|uniref:MFS general substrate transporter n=1 Tax=Neolentinus lepideus HHB14362 ss-1 TaxID=1314782 RepID=A0A165QSQ6_9AGAM|nr:MFS general substrate transporter [Neolentinus lepideus HHB14362 ss-1]
MTDVPVASASTAPVEDKREKQFTRDFWVVPIPKRLRHDPKNPPKFGLVLNATFGFASTFVVSNLYYCQPLLIEFSKSFSVSYDRVSNIPTLVQAGYATGLLLISPLGDLVRRRQLILLLVILSTSLSIGLCVTHSLAAFEALCFLVGAVTVTPQILMPLAADLAPPERKASAISIVLSGLLFGILIARVLAGIIGQFTSWRVVYYFAVGVQCLSLTLLYLVLPDYPAKNPEMSYFGILYTMAKFAVTEPMLIQTSLINIASSANFTNFWVTLTFLLGGPPYHYTTLAIGLFGLIGMFGVCMGPLVGRLIDRLVPWYATLVATLALIVFQAIETGAGGINIAAVIIMCLGLDVFRQMQQLSLTTVVFTIDEKARGRLNAVVILSLFIGQVMGTAVGSKVFVKYGWRAAAGLSLGLCGWQLLILMLRGPHCKRHTWFGYEGGWESRKSVVMERKRMEAEAKSGVETRRETTVDEKNVEDGSAEKQERQSDDAEDIKEDVKEKEDIKEKDPSRMTTL